MMTDYFGREIRPHIRVMVYSSDAGRYVSGKVVDCSRDGQDYFVKVRIDDPVDQFRTHVGSLIQDTVVLNESDPRVTKFILEKSVP